MYKDSAPPLTEMLCSQTTLAKVVVVVVVFVVVEIFVVDTAFSMKSVVADHLVEESDVATSHPIAASGHDASELDR